MVYGTSKPTPRGTDPQADIGPSTAANNRDRIVRDYKENIDPVGGALGGLFGLGKKRRKPPDYLFKDDASGGTESVLRSFEGGQSSADAIQQLLGNFKGSKEDLADFMEIVGPMMGGLESRRLEQSPGLDYMSDQRNWDMGAMGGYGAAAGQMGAGTRQAITQSQQGLAASGLGRGAGSTAITAMLRGQNTSNQANLRSQLEQQSARNRMSSANTLLDAHRTIAQLALGQQITPRITSPQGTDTGIGGIGQGAAAGASVGAVAGPWGALIGAGVGAGAGYAASRQNK